jgi:HSP20 family protein
MANLAPSRRPSAGSSGQWPSFEQVPERMRRMFEHTFGGFAAPPLLSQTSTWTPAVDLEEEDEAYVVEADLPAAQREDVHIELLGNELSITGEIRKRERKGIVRQRRRRTGRFAYRVSLPSPLASDRIEAKLADGVLTLRVPKAERAQRQRVEVTDW